MKRILILTENDFINPEVARQNIFKATPKREFNEIDYELIIFENQVIKNRFGDVGDLNLFDFNEFLTL